MLFIKFNFKGGYMRLDYLKQEYENLRFTIHSPSEHIIDGVGYDLELQFFN
jgi:carbonic anhydrase